MTEVGLATLNPPAGPIKQRSIGPPIGGFSIVLRDEDGGSLEPGTVGRVWIRSRSRMAGYWEAPDATAEVVREGWLDSGDLARADEDGYFWFFGRKKLRPNAELSSSADLIVFCRDRVGYKAPEEVVVLDEMPLNPTGKIDRVGLKRMAEGHLHPHGLPDDSPG